MPRLAHDAHPEATPLPTVRDDDLVRFEAEGPWSLPPADVEGFVETEGARIWFATFGRGPAAILLHGGLGNAGNWGYQVRALVRVGHRAVVVDTRGHGRSTWDGRPLGYAQLASDVGAVLRAVGVGWAHLVGWSDGAVVALLLAAADPAAVAGVLFFGCNVDASGTLPFEFTPVVGRSLQRHRLDGVSHFAPVQRPEVFDGAVAAFLARVSG